MNNPDEDEIVERLDREFTGRGSLIALGVCFLLCGWLVAATALDVLGYG